MLRAFQSVDGVAEVGVFLREISSPALVPSLFTSRTYILSGLNPNEALGGPLYPCRIITLYHCVARKRKEVQNTAQEETTQYLKGNALTVQKGNCESETPSLSQSPYRKQKETIKSIPVNEAIETGVKVSAV